jgi:hypothetical protein
LENFTFSVITSIVASLIVAYFTAKITIGSRYGEATKRLFVAIMKYYFVNKALISPDKLKKVNGGSSFKEIKDEQVYLQNIESIYTTICNILDSTASSELLGKNLDVASLPISLSMEIYNFKTTKLISNKACLKDMFNIMDFLLEQKPIKKLQGQKIHNEISLMHKNLNDSYLEDQLGFNPNRCI